MVDAVAKKRKISEDDLLAIFSKYSATRVLVLLREVAQWPEVKIDWNALVQNTATGIDNAREYQMLWRHLAYRQPLLDEIKPAVRPLDDDSDLEYELEASPPVSTEIVMDAANCVKVLAFGSPKESGLQNNLPDDGDMPNGHSSKISLEHPHPTLLPSSNMTLPVSVQKNRQPVGISGEGLDASGAANINISSCRKRKPWSEKEDLQLINAVRKQKMGNWATIAKEEFNGTRTAGQISKRWGIIKKKQGNLNVGGNGSLISEEHVATRNALQHALKDPLTAVGSKASSACNPGNLNASKKDSPVTNITVGSQQQLAHSKTSAKPGQVGSMSTPCTFLKEDPAKPSVTSDSIQAAAVAAGARIASLSDAKSLFEVAHVRNTMHNFKGGSLIKTSADGNTCSLPPNVHFIRTGLTATPPTRPAETPSCAPGASMSKCRADKPSGSTEASASLLSRTKTVPMAPLEPSNDTSFSKKVHQMEAKISAEIKALSSEKIAIAITESKEDTASLLQCSPKVICEQGQSTSSSKDKNVGKHLADGDNS